MENKEMTVKQIKSKINQTEKKIDEIKKGIEGNNRWVANFEKKIEELKTKGGYTSSITGTEHFIKVDESRIDFEIKDSQMSIKRWNSYTRESEKKLNKYEAQLSELKGLIEGQTKEYKVVRDFVNLWKENCIAHIKNPETIKCMLADYEEMKNQVQKIEDDCKAKGIPSWKSYNERESVKKAFSKKWSFVSNYYSFRENKIDEENLKKDYQYESERKYDKLVEDVEFYVGEILNVSELEIGYDGNLNGVVEGKNGKVRVQTILAGGYNIQCLHFRCLYSKMN